MEVGFGTGLQVEVFAPIRSPHEHCRISPAVAVGIGRDETLDEADAIEVGGVRSATMDHLAVMERHLAGPQFDILDLRVVDLVVGEMLERD